MSHMRRIEWRDFPLWCQGKLPASQTESKDCDENTVTIEFTDGSKAEIRSNYDPDYSEYTPGNGLEVPKVWVSP